MTPEHLLQAVKRGWPLALLSVLAVLGAFVGTALVAPPEYSSTLTLSVQPPDQAEGSDDMPNINSSFLQFVVPAVQERAASKQLRDSIDGPSRGTRESEFDVTTSVTPNSGLVAVTVQSRDRSVILPVLSRYSARLTAFPAEARLPITVKVLQPALAPAPASRTATLAIAVAEGLVLGLLLGLVLCLALARARRSRHLTERIEERFGLPVLAVLAKDDDGGLSQLDEFLRVAAQVHALERSGRSCHVAVVAARSAVGRTLVAAGTARALAVLAGPVVLVDADVRRPGLPAPLQDLLEPSRAARPSDEQLPLASTSVDGLSYLGNADLLATVSGRGHAATPSTAVVAAVHTLVERTRGGEVTLVVDTSAVDGAPEVDGVLSSVDGVVLVLDGGAPGRSLAELARLLRQLDGLGVRCLGVVVNRAPRRVGRVLRRATDDVTGVVGTSPAAVGAPGTALLPAARAAAQAGAGLAAPTARRR